jgi:hypothetical protein
VIIRELLTSMGIDFDTKGADQAEKRIDSLKGALGKLAAGFSVYQAFGFLKSMVDESSAAEQALAKLNMMFGEYSGGVKAWAATTAEATGASEYQLREFAGTFGSMLVPTLKGNQKLAAEMSTTLSALAVDLAAINNEDPGQTLGRLFSGMTGETEAVERLGIGIKAAALQEFAHERGIKKKVTAMSIAEKTELIYNKILKDTKLKTGQAAAESKQYAGQMLKLSAAWRDFKTKGGDQIKDLAKGWVLEPLIKLTNWLKDMVSHTSILTTLLIAGAAALTAWGISWVVASWPILVTVAALAVLIVALDDVMGYFTGKRSLIGDFFSALGDGVDMLAHRIKFINDTIRTLRELVDGSWLEEWMAKPAVATESNDRQRKRANVLRGKPLTEDERAAEREKAKAAAQEALGMSIMPVNLPNQLPSSIKLPTNGAATPAVQNKTGDVNLHLHGAVPKETIDAGEKAARRLLEQTHRHTLYTTSTRK